MRISLQVLAFNVDRTLNAMLRNAGPYVDKIFIAYPERAWRYGKKNSITLNPTKLMSINTALPCEVEIIMGDWEKDEDTRNHLLRIARLEDFDWMIIQDADEFYTSDSWQRLISRLKEPETLKYDCIKTPYFTFWKSPAYILHNRQEGIKNGTTTFALNCRDRDLYFSYSRTTTAVNSIFMDMPCYHYSYVLSDNEMKLKINTWAHTGDLISKDLWYNIKWKRWHGTSKLLHPGSPWMWDKAIRFPLPQPAFASEIKAEEHEQKDLSIYWVCIEIIYDLYSKFRQTINGLKRLLRASVRSEC